MSDTDRFLKRPHVAWDGMWIEFARRLEAERDEARKALGELADCYFERRSEGLLELMMRANRLAPKT